MRDALIDLPFYKILLFISFLDNNKIENQINEFIKIFSLQDTQDNREKIKQFIDYFFHI